MTGAGVSPESGVPVWRLNVLRVFYLLIGLGMGVGVWQQLLAATPDWPLMRGIAKAMLAALALLCLLGAAFPLRMLPLLMFECGWKTAWLLLIALPAWRSGRMSADQLQTFYECVGVVVLYVAMPWRYIWRTTFGAGMEPWRRSPSTDPAA